MKATAKLRLLIPGLTVISKLRLKAERIRVGPAGQVGIAGANCGQWSSFNSGGASGAVSWQDAAAGATGVILENQQAISSNYTLTTNYNGLSVGPVTIQNSIAVTVPNGAVWMIL